MLRRIDPWLHLAIVFTILFWESSLLLSDQRIRETWSFDTGFHYSWPDSVALGPDGTIYICSPGLLAISPDGQQKWSGPCDSQPAIGSDGSIYVVTGHDNLIAFNSDGSEKWSFSGAEYWDAGPVIGHNETIYTNTKSYLIAISSEGKELWRWTGQIIQTPPTVGPDGTVYAGVHRDSQFGIVAFTWDGQKKWIRTVTDELFMTAPTTSPDGTVYFGSDDEYLYAIGPDGTHKWSFKTNGAIKSAPRVGKNGTVYFGSSDTYLYALNPDGSEKWRFQTDSQIESTPFVDEEGTIIVGSNDKHLYAINPDGTQKWSFKTGAEVASPTVSSEGIIYVGSHDRKLYALDGLFRYGFAQFADGQGISSRLSLINLDSYGSAFVRIELRDSSGFPITVDLNGAIVNGSTEIEMPASSLSILETDGEGPIQTGSLFISSDRNTSGTLLFSGDFGLAGVGVSEFDSNFLLPVQNSQSRQIYDGIAFMNSEASEIEIDLNLRDQDGLKVATAQMTLTAKGHSALHLNEIEWTQESGEGSVAMQDFDLEEFNGTVEVTSDASELGVLAIETRPKQYATLPVSISSQSNAHTNWIFKTRQPIRSSPTIGSDATIYVGSEDGNLYAITPEGNEKWKFKTDYWIHLSPVIGPDGTIYVASLDDRLYAVTPDGVEKWRYKVRDRSAINSLAVGPDGTIYIFEYRESISSLDSGGSLNWSKTFYGLEANLVVSEDGTIFVQEFGLEAWDPEGNLKWELKSEKGENVMICVPPVLRDSTIYSIDCDDGSILLVNPDGTIIRRIKFPWGTASEGLVVGPEGTIYSILGIRTIGDSTRKYWIASFDEAGGEIWRTMVSKYRLTGLTLGSDGTIYTPDENSILFSLDTEGQLKWTYETSGAGNPPTIGRDSSVILTALDHKVYSLADNTKNYFAQFATGGDISSQINMFNLNRDKSTQVNAQFKSPNGEPLELTINNEFVSGEIDLEIPALGSRILLAESEGQIQVGSVTVSSDRMIGGNVIFGGSHGLAGVEGSVPVSQGFQIPAECNKSLEIHSGIVLMNLESKATTVNLQLLNSDGVLMSESLIVLPPEGQKAQFLSEIEWDSPVDLSNFNGILKGIVVIGKIGATAILTHPGQFATLPIISSHN